MRAKTEQRVSWKVRIAWLGLALVALSPLAFWGSLQGGERPLSGLKVAGLPVPVDGDVRAWLQKRAEAWAAQTVIVRVGPYTTRATRRDLGASLSVDAMRTRLLARGRSGNPVHDLSTYWRAARHGEELAWLPDVDTNRLHAWAVAFRKEMQRPPLPGTTDPEGNEVPGIPGLELNALDAVAAIKLGLRDNARRMRVKAVEIPPPPPIVFDDLADPQNFAVLLMEHRTRYRLSKEGRATNIERAAELIDGYIMKPGETFSFNAVVGDRNEDRGFAEALEIRNQRMVTGTGGGVCQVAATLHAAAFKAGMHVPVHQPHSRPARYIDLGLGTMVYYPNKDLVIRNPYPFPVSIEAHARDGEVYVGMRGAGRPFPVEWHAEIVERIPSTEERTVKEPGVAPGTVIQRPAEGVVVERTRTVQFPTGPKHEKRLMRYPPVPKVTAG